MLAAWRMILFYFLSSSTFALQFETGILLMSLETCSFHLSLGPSVLFAIIFIIQFLFVIILMFFHHKIFCSFSQLILRALVQLCKILYIFTFAVFCCTTLRSLHNHFYYRRDSCLYFVPIFLIPC